MRQNIRISKDVQHPDQINADFLKQMIELEKLREAVRLAEAGKPSEKLRRPRINPEFIEPLAGSSTQQRRLGEANITRRCS
jgi:hypothetical protein